MDAKKRKKLPYGNSNFESVRTENYVYIDKTRFIELLENEGNKNIFFTRPRKFGKSLFFSMLSNYYDIKQADKFEQLFGELYIGKHPTPGHNAYMVLKFNFSGLDTFDEESFNTSLSGKVQNYILDFMEKYEYLFPKGDIYSEQIIAEKPGVFSIQKAFSAAASAGKKLYIIIDEYDHFANDLIALGTFAGESVYRHVVRANGIIRDFYETLKEGSETVIDRIILTGITPIMLDDVTSGFNISNNISLKPQYNELLGFTKEEVNALMKEIDITPDMISVDMEYLYDGYLFHSEGENRVYNPSMMLYLFDQVREDGKIRYVIDDNLKTDYSRLRMLMTNEDNRKQLTQIIKDNTVKSEIIPKFPIDKLHDSEYFFSLLFYMGLLTIDRLEEGLLFLKVPNYSIQTIYWEYIKEMIKEDSPEVLINMNQQREALQALAYRANPALFVEHISENIFKRLSYRDLMNFDEKYIKIMILYGLFQSNLYVTITELEVSTGYVDIYMHRNPVIPGIPYEWVWEIKYVKKEDASESVLKAKREEARTQLKKYRDSYMFAGRADVHYLSLIFIGKDRYEIEELMINADR